MSESVVEIGLLGSLQVRRDGHLVLIRGTRERTLLAALAFRAGRAARSDELIDGLWHPERLPTNPMNSLHAAVSRLRRQLAGQGASLLVASGTGYTLAVRPEQSGYVAVALFAVTAIGIIVAGLRTGTKTTINPDDARITRAYATGR